MSDVSWLDDFEFRYQHVVDEAQAVLNDKIIPLAGRVAYYQTLPEDIKRRVALPILVHVVSKEGGGGLGDREVSLTQGDLEKHPSLVGVLRGSSAMREGKLVGAGSGGSGVDVRRLVLPVGIPEEVGWAYLHLVGGGDVDALKRDVSFLVSLYVLCEYYSDGVCQEQVGAFLLKHMQGASLEDHLGLLLFALTVIQNKELVEAITTGTYDVVSKSEITFEECQEVMIGLGWGIQERGVISAFLLSIWLDSDVRWPLDEFQVKLARYKEVVGDNGVYIDLSREASRGHLQAVISAFPNIRSFKLFWGREITAVPEGIEQFKHLFFLTCPHLLCSIPLEERIELLRRMDGSQDSDVKENFIKWICCISVGEVVDIVDASSWTHEEKERVVHWLLNPWIKEWLQAHEDRARGMFWSGLEMFKEYLSGYPVELEVQQQCSVSVMEHLIKAFPQMKSLVLKNQNSGLVGVYTINGLVALEKCHIRYCIGAVISGLSGASLQELVLENNEGMGREPNNFPLHLDKLKRCTINGCNYQSLERLNGTPIEELELAQFDHFNLPVESSTVDLPVGLSKLKQLTLRACGWLTSLAPLSGLGLVRLKIVGSLRGFRSRVAVAFPEHLAKLEELEIEDCNNIQSLRSLEGAPLKRIVLCNLEFSPEMPSLPPGCEVINKKRGIWR